MACSCRGLSLDGSRAIMIGCLHQPIANIFVLTGMLQAVCQPILLNDYRNLGAVLDCWCVCEQLVVQTSTARVSSWAHSHMLLYFG